MNYKYLQEDVDPTFFAIGGQAFGAIWNNGLATKIPVIGKYMLGTVVAKEVIEQGSVIYRNYFEKAMSEVKTYTTNVENLKKSTNDKNATDVLNMTSAILRKRESKLNDATGTIMKDLDMDTSGKMSAFLSGLKIMTIGQYSALLKAVRVIAEDSSIASKDMNARIASVPVGQNKQISNILNYCKSILMSCTKLDFKLVNDVGPLLGATVISVAANQPELFIKGAQVVTQKAITKGLITTAAEGAVLKSVIKFAALPVGMFTLGSDLLQMALPFMLESFQKVLNDTSQKLSILSKLKQEFAPKLRKDINSYLDQTIQLCYQRKNYTQNSIDEIQRVGTNTGETVLLYTIGGYIKAFKISCNGISNFGVQARSAMLRLKVLKVAGGEETRLSKSQLIGGSGGGFEYHTKEAGDQTLDTINKQVIDSCYICLASFEQTDGNLISKLNETTNAINETNKKKMNENEKIKDAVTKNDTAITKVNDAISRTTQPQKQTVEPKPIKQELKSMAPSSQNKQNSFYSLVSNPNFAKGVAGVAASSVLIYVLWKYGAKMFSKIKSWWRNLWSKDGEKDNEGHTK